MEHIPEAEIVPLVFFLWKTARLNRGIERIQFLVNDPTQNHSKSINLSELATGRGYALLYLWDL
jgi:hypothetical protein